MKCISKLIVGLVIGAMLGLWFGVNIGRERPLLSNPKAGRGLFDSADDAIKKGTDNIREKFKE